MPIPVSCSCGKKFAAKEEMAGKRLKCPACSAVIAIPQPPAASASATPAPAQPVDPLFGNDPFGAPASSGGGAFDLGNLSAFETGPAAPLGDATGGGFGAPAGPSASGPLAGASAGSMGGAYGGGMGGGSYGASPMNAARGPAPAAASGGMDFGMKLALFGGGGAILLIGGVICVFALISSLGSAPVAQYTPPPTMPAVAPPVTPVQPVPTPQPPVVPATTGTTTGPAVPPPAFPPSTSTPATGTTPATGPAPPAFPPSATPSTPDPGATTPGITTPGTATTGTRPPRGSRTTVITNTSGKPLSGAISGWHGQANSQLVGMRSVKDEAMASYQYSWMCDLLPFLGYEKIYNEFDFKKPWNDDRNFNTTRYVIPQFLNPSDPRIGWKGYPFQGSVLTHYVGISGIEDQRNVVAAELPRSDPRAGVFGYRGVAQPSEITDGTSNTLMVIGSGELAGLWVQGGGATVRGAREPYFDSLTGFGSKGGPEPGAMAMFADGSVRHIPAKIDPKVFRALCTIHGAETVDLAPLGEKLANFPVKK